MTLNEYMAKLKINNTEFAQQIKVTARAVGHYRVGARIPKHDVMRRIGEVTDGAVTANDFYSHKTAPSTPCGISPQGIGQGVAHD